MWIGVNCEVITCRQTELPNWSRALRFLLGRGKKTLVKHFCLPAFHKVSLKANAEVLSKIIWFLWLKFYMRIPDHHEQCGILKMYLALFQFVTQDTLLILSRGSNRHFPLAAWQNQNLHLGQLKKELLDSTSQHSFMGYKKRVQKKTHYRFWWQFWYDNSLFITHIHAIIIWWEK